MVTALGVAIPVVYVCWLLFFVFRANADLRRIRHEEGLAHPELFKDESKFARSTFFEYRSQSALMGLPMVHVRFGGPPGEAPKAAKGWIAVGDRAVGVLFAMGGIAAGGVSLGGVSVGLISFGGAAIGLLSLGGLAMGGISTGGLAIGWLATGGMAVGWKAAVGGMAVAREYAVGGATFARHANDIFARDFVLRHTWLDPKNASSRKLFGFVTYGIPSAMVIVVLVISRLRWRRESPTGEGKNAAR